MKAPRKPRQAQTRDTERLLLHLTQRMAEAEGLDAQLQILIDIATQALKAERGTIFLNDPDTRELYSRVVVGGVTREIRILNGSGLAGHVFTEGAGLIVPDAYADERFNPDIDRRTGFKTRNVLTAPIRTLRGEPIGVAQILNKIDGAFSGDDLSLVTAMNTQAAIVLKGSLFVQTLEASRKQENAFLGVVTEASTEIMLGPLLQKIMSAVTRMLNAERSTLFLNDEKTGELYTEIGEGLGAQKIRLPNTAGIAGAVFTSGRSVNIPHAYADLRFNPGFDKKTGFFTRSILCVPVANKAGKVIGVTQVLNKRGGVFTAEDEARLKAFTAQISIGLENAKLFDDVQTVKNYNESMLESMSNGVLTVSPEGHIVTANAAAARILKRAARDLADKPAAEVFPTADAWVLERIAKVTETGAPEHTIDAALAVGDATVSVNMTVSPLRDGKGKAMGTMLLIEDISSEKRMKSTMSRYMDAALADRLLEAGEDILGGQAKPATVLFSDIRSFTTLSEELGAQGIVQLLNAYFTRMVDCIQAEGGMLDKFIGDAIMAVFGTPLGHDDDEDRAVRAAIAMLRELADFNLHRTAAGSRPLAIGIGLNTDTVVSGNIGSPKRMDYTVIGDGVNLASRLESASKQYGAQALLSEFTVEKLKSTYRMRDIDKVVVKGKTEAVGVYELLEFHTPESFPNMAEVLGHFREGIGLYRGRDFAAAQTAFTRALAARPEDKPSQLYIDRCAHFLAEPPPENWSGEWVLSSK
ncbi:GAF domain-containing protein [Oleispirillum naphthae]|uniref:GAF domain-containing protein n=1 Tax=Oleispirillum naphthae TaxID=2838853 RepID=UPI0030824CC4